MLRQILGKNIIERDADWLKLKSQNKKVIVDLGCGDGLYAYRQALQKPDNLYLAIDANSQVLQKLSNKVEHQKLGNLIYLQHTAESLPLELNSKVDQLMILYPWGSLLKIVATAETELQTVFKILKIPATAEILFTYSSEYELAMIQEYQLPILSTDFIQNIKTKFSALGFTKIELITTTDKEIINHTSWGKKINSKHERIVWRAKLGNQ